MGTDESSILFVADCFLFPGKGVEDDLDRVECHVEPPGDIDVFDGMDGQATRGVQGSHSTLEVGL